RSDVCSSDLHQFVLIEVPWALRFDDLQRKVMEEINRRQEWCFEKARQLQKQLMDYVITGKNWVEILHLVERERNGEIILINSKNRMKANRKEPQKLLQLWKELEQSTQVDLDESVFRHLQKYPYNGGILMKKEITSGPQHSVQGFFILYFFDEQLLTPIAYQMVES